MVSVEEVCQWENREVFQRYSERCGTAYQASTITTRLMIITDIVSTRNNQVEVLSLV